MGYNGISSSVCCGTRVQTQYPGEWQPMRRSSYSNGGSAKLTSIPSSGKYCPYCNKMVAKCDPDGEDIPGSNGKKRHKSCRLAVAQGKNTELCEITNP